MAHLRSSLSAPIWARFREPFPLPLTPYIRSGYLKRGATIAELAATCGIAPAACAETVTVYNDSARRGEDPEFGRGSTPYNRKQGDPLHGPNPCVAPIEHGPFYAVKVLPGCFGTFAGLKTNGFAQVLGPEARPIAGLYAVGRTWPASWRPLPVGRHQPGSGHDVRLYRGTTRPGVAATASAVRR